MLTVNRDSRQNLSHVQDHDQCGDDKRCLPTRLLISGLPRAQRESRIIMAIQVAIDDSNRGQEDQPAFILAGFLATAPNWMHFSDDWQDELDREPSISLLKASEAINLKKNFAGWTEQERDARLLSFVAIIRQYTFASVHTSLAKRSFERVFSGYTGALKKMYAEATVALITRVMHFAKKNKMRQSFEYIFDEGIMSPNQLRDMHREATERLKGYARLIKKFRHDTDDNFYPLQAADLFAGYYRERLVAESEGRIFQSFVLDALMTIPHIDGTISDHQLEYVKRGIDERNNSLKPRRH